MGYKEKRHVYDSTTRINLVQKAVNQTSGAGSIDITGQLEEFSY